MGTVLRLNMKQLLCVLFILLSLVVIAVIVLHAATPHLLHEFALRPNVFNRR